MTMTTNMPETLTKYRKREKSKKQHEDNKERLQKGNRDRYREYSKKEKKKTKEYTKNQDWKFENKFA